MYAYMTTGTYSFLRKIEEKHVGEKLLLMQNADSSLLYHETNGASFFQAPRKYEIILSLGEFTSEGYIACEFIPVRDEGRPVFEFAVTDRDDKVDQEPGFQALRILRPLSSDTYVIMTMWHDQKAFSAWKTASSFKNTHTHMAGDKIGESANVFSASSYLSTYFVTEEELEEGH